MSHFYQGWIIGMCMLLVSCNTGTTYAPVTDINDIEPIPKTGQHHVASGETLYEIAWRYGLDYRTVADKNDMRPPYHLQAGQSVYLRDKKPISADNGVTIVKAPIVKTPPPSVIAPVISKKEPQYAVSTWLKPAKGKIIRSFSGNNKGIDIRGKVGEAVFAAAPGKVVYSGDGLRGYGNLIIIKHNNVYLSAYAYNRVNKVREGDWVKQGQMIGEMGTNRSGVAVLHFEIRRAGKPVNPMFMLS